METAKRLVFDTNVCTAAIREGLFGPTLRTLQAALPRTFLASVVTAQLLAGTTTQGARRAVLDLTRWAHRVRRVVSPDARSWERTGGILSEIRGKEPHLRSKIPTLWTGTTCLSRCVPGTWVQRS